jgi:osmotically-inducible protein OsmY
MLFSPRSAAILRGRKPTYVQRTCPGADFLPRRPVTGQFGSRAEKSKLNGIKEKRAMRIKRIMVATVALLLTGPVLAEKTAGEMVDDVGLAAQVKTNLIDSKVVDANDVNVEVDKGVVQLSGFVKSEEQRREAANIANDIVGVKKVNNKLVVGSGKRSMGQTVEDQYIETKVNAALMAEKDTDAGDIDVEVRNGVVQLSGFVSSAAEKKRATEVAAGIEGVTKVDNALDLKN